MVQLHFQHMRYAILPLVCTFALASLLGACKKKSEPAAPAAGQEPAAPSTTVTAPARPESPATQAPATAQGVVLKVKWPLGNRYVYRLDLDQHSTNRFPQMPKPMQQDVTMAMTYALAVVTNAPNDGRELEMEFLSNEMEVKMAEQVVMSFDSKENPQKEGQNPFAGPFRKMIGSKLRMVVDADGNVQKVVGLEEWVKSLAGEGTGPAEGMLAQQFNEGFFRQIASFGKGLSPKPVQVGDSWPFKLDMPAAGMGTISVNATIMLKDWEKHDDHQCAVLDSIGTMKGTAGDQPGPMGKMSLDQGKLSGRSWFDAELGALIESVVDQSMQLKGEMPAPPGGNRAAPSFTTDIAQKVTVKLVELTTPDKK